MAGQRKLRMGMVGGGPGALSGQYTGWQPNSTARLNWLRGRFRNRRRGRAQRARHTRSIPIAPTLITNRCWRREEAPDAIDFVAIVTPNHLHLPVALASLAAGFR